MNYLEFLLYLIFTVILGIIIGVVILIIRKSNYNRMIINDKIKSQYTNKLSLRIILITFLIVFFLIFLLSINLNDLIIAITFDGFFGKFDGFFYAIITFVVIDYITGVMCAIVKKELSSQIGYKGILKKMFIFMLIGIANVIDVNILNGNSVLRTTVIFFYIANEGISILENAACLGLPIPEKFKAVLEQLKKDNKSDRSNNNDTENQNNKK